jgi:hypothetical protein
MVDGIDQHASGVEHMDGGNNTSSIAHEVFNNIFIRCNGKVGDSNRYSNTANFEGSSDGVINLMLTNGTSREKWDYNVYWRDPAVSPQHGLFHYIRAQAGAPFQSFATLAAFRASALFTGSQSHYGPGFEANGFEFKPTFGTIDDFPAARLSYRPAPHQNLNTGQTSSLAGESTSGWPAQPSNWKGPLDPHGTTMPISVQNP